MPTWVRVRDKSTGHEYDVAASAVREDAHEVLKDYPENSGLTARPRPAKHRAAKGRKAANRTAGESAEEKE